MTKGADVPAPSRGVTESEPGRTVAFGWDSAGALGGHGVGGLWGQAGQSPRGGEELPLDCSRGTHCRRIFLLVSGLQQKDSRGQIEADPETLQKTQSEKSNNARRGIRQVVDHGGDMLGSGSGDIHFV